MELSVDKINLSYKFDDNCFDLDSFITTNDITEDTSEMFNLIMTYDGEKSFLLVEETLDVFDEFTVIPTMGEPYQLLDTLGVMTDNSLSWVSGNTEYYLVSDVMSVSELLEVAESIVAVPALK